MRAECAGTQHTHKFNVAEIARFHSARKRVRAKEINQAAKADLIFYAKIRVREFIGVLFDGRAFRRANRAPDTRGRAQARGMHAMTENESFCIVTAQIMNKRNIDLRCTGRERGKEREEERKSEIIFVFE